MRSARHDPFKSTVARPAQIHRARTLHYYSALLAHLHPEPAGETTCPSACKPRRRARRAAPVPGAARPPCAGRHRHRRDSVGRAEGFSRTGKTPGISFLVEIFGEIPPRPGQVGNTWEMHYGTNTGSCGVHLVLLRPSQHSGARPGVGPHDGQILVQHRGHRVFAKLNLGTPCLGTN